MSLTALRSLPRRHEGRTDVLPPFMFGAVVFMSILILGCLSIVFWISFIKGEPDAEHYYTLQNYISVALDERTYDVLWNTLGFAATSLAVAFFFGIPAAWLVERTNLPGKTLVFTLMTIGLLMPGFAAAMGWLFLMHRRIGLLNTWMMQAFGLTSGPFDISTILGMGWVQGLNLAPLSFIMTAAVFRAMDPSLEESAQMSGARGGRIMRAITLPLAWPGILAAGIYIFTIGFAAFDVPAILGWGSRIFTFSTFLYLLTSPEDVLPHYGMAAALSGVIVVTAALLGWWYARMQQRARRYAVITGKAYRPRMGELGRWVWPAWGFLAAYFILSKLVPVLMVIWASLLPYFMLPDKFAFSQVSLDQYFTLPWRLVLTGLGNTAILMALTPTITLLLSLGFSWVVLRSRLPGRALFDFIAFLPHAVPNIVFGVGVILLTLYVLQTVLPLYGTIWILLLVFIVARVSYGTRMTNSGMIQIHSELEESAQVSGATTFATFREIVVPLLAPTLIYAWLWIALLVFRELTLAVILTTPRNMTLPVVIWSTWLGGGLGQSSALVVLMLCLMIPLVALYWFVAARHGLLSARGDA
ncbi:MAG: iron ABC transporter permease [Deltaproteobacteria bacterium]|nr:iron ABC transporter permease [Deltaproteobacteria bacterium]